MLMMMIFSRSTKEPPTFSFGSKFTIRNNNIHKFHHCRVVVTIALLLLALPSVVTCQKDVTTSDTDIHTVRSLQGVGITDATANFVPSTESKYDHMVNIEDNLSFHWNDFNAKEKIMGRLIHKADSIEQAPSWLGMGLWHSNHNYTTLPTTDTTGFMVGSYAMVGLVTEAEEATPASHYFLGDQVVTGITETADTSIQSSTILQHDSDDGTVITELTFTKHIEENDTPSSMARIAGVNVFIWAVGPPGGTLGVLSKHSMKGVLFLDFAAVKAQVEGTTTSGGGTVETGATTIETSAPGAEATTTTATATSISATSNSQQQLKPDNRPNTAPQVTAECTATILGEGPGFGKVALTPTSTFYFQVMGDKIQLALEHVGTHPVWLGIASSPNGYMVGSSAIIGSPGDDDKAISPPKQFLLMDQDQSGIQETPDAYLEFASVGSVASSSDSSKEITTMKFTKYINDANDPVPILTTEGGTVATFLYAVGESRELAYHEHRGQFRVDLMQCGGKVLATSTSTAVWTNSALFATHGFFAAVAWAFLTPFAITVAWFRTLVPASWIYIHVLANVSTAILTVFVFALAVGGVAKQDGADHYSKAHHWVGTVLMGVAAFQVTNGFLRPPVERKDSPLPSQQYFMGFFPVPRTPRETWHTTHHLIGLSALAMGIYQMQSGLKLYAMRFQVTSIVNYYWAYVGLVVLGLIVLKLYVIREEDKARRGVLHAVSTSEPGPSEDEEHVETVGMGHTMA
jgi:hypothetical protein